MGVDRDIEVYIWRECVCEHTCTCLSVVTGDWFQDSPRTPKSRTLQSLI